MSRRPYLVAALLTLALLAAILIGGIWYVGSIERQYIHALAPYIFLQKNQGSALQREAFRQPDLLPVYGSSELGIDDPYNASNIFKNYPTGFAVFPIGMDDTEPLIITQKLAAVGGDLRGKKVVISLSAIFFSSATYHARSYLGNFSRLHAMELAYSTDLQLALKQDVARRMLQYPKSLEKEPLLKFALEKLVDGSPASLALYYASLPFGKLQTFVYELQDHWETLAHIRSKPKRNPNVAHRPQTLDWAALRVQATEAYKQHANNNLLGMDNLIFNQIRDRLIAAEDSTSDEVFLGIVERSTEWTDLDLLLRELKDLGAQPLITCMPMKGIYNDYHGISSNARQIFYQKLREAVGKYGMPLVNFQDHDPDKYFLIDPSDHLSSKGWIYYDQTFDAFYHDALH